MNKRIAKKLLTGLSTRGVLPYSRSQAQAACLRISRLGIGSGMWARIGRRIQRDISREAGA